MIRTPATEILFAKFRLEPDIKMFALFTVPGALIEEKTEKESFANLHNIWTFAENIKKELNEGSLTDAIIIGPVDQFSFQMIDINDGEDPFLGVFYAGAKVDLVNLVERMVENAKLEAKSKRDAELEDRLKLKATPEPGALSLTPPPARPAKPAGLNGRTVIEGHLLNKVRKHVLEWSGNGNADGTSYEVEVRFHGLNSPKPVRGARETNEPPQTFRTQETRFSRLVPKHQWHLKATYRIRAEKGGTFGDYCEPFDCPAT